MSLPLLQLFVFPILYFTLTWNCAAGTVLEKNCGGLTVIPRWRVPKIGEEFAPPDPNMDPLVFPLAFL
jgi:hypothetical protein